MPAPAPAPPDSPPGSTSPETAPRDPAPAPAAATAISPGPLRVGAIERAGVERHRLDEVRRRAERRNGRDGRVVGSVRSERHGVGTGSGPSSDPAGGTSVARLTPGGGGEGSGPNGAIPPEYEAYVRALRQRVQERLQYPWTAVRRGQQGVVEVELRVGPDGRLVAVEVVAGPTADALRVAAVSAVRGAAPFPFPAGLPPRPLVIRLPVEFRLR